MPSLHRFAFPAFALLMLVLPALPVPDFWITQSNYIGLYALVALGLVLLTGVAAVTVRWPILRPSRALSFPYRCKCIPGRANTRSHGGVVSVSPAANQRSPSRLSMIDGLCWRGCGSGRPARARTCSSNCETSQASML